MPTRSPLKEMEIAASSLDSSRHQDSVPVDPSDAIRFGFLIHDVSRLRRILIDRALKHLGVTRSQWFLLSFLSRRDGMTQSSLASDLDLTKVAVGNLLERMEGQGLVERRSDAGDARIRRVYLTRVGTRLVRDIRGQVEKAELIALGSYNDKELAVTVRTLQLMKAQLRARLEELGE